MRSVWLCHSVRHLGTDNLPTRWRIVFDDGHDSGIYTWKYLKELGETGDRLFADYKRELAEKGLSREPRYR